MRRQTRTNVICGSVLGFVFSCWLLFYMLNGPDNRETTEFSASAPKDRWTAMKEHPIATRPLKDAIHGAEEDMPGIGLGKELDEDEEDGGLLEDTTEAPDSTTVSRGKETTEENTEKVKEKTKEVQTHKQPQHHVDDHKQEQHQPHDKSEKKGSKVEKIQHEKPAPKKSSEERKHITTSEIPETTESQPAKHEKSARIHKGKVRGDGPTTETPEATTEELTVAKPDTEDELDELGDERNEIVPDGSMEHDGEKIDAQEARSKKQKPAPENKVGEDLVQNVDEVQNDRNQSTVTKVEEPYDEQKTINQDEDNGVPDEQDAQGKEMDDLSLLKELESVPDRSASEGSIVPPDAAQISQPLQAVAQQQSLLQIQQQPAGVQGIQTAPLKVQETSHDEMVKLVEPVSNATRKKEQRVDWERFFSFIPNGLQSCPDLFPNLADKNPLPEDFIKAYVEYEKMLRSFQINETHTGEHLEQFIVYYFLVRAPFVQTVCETGLGAGHSTFLWLQANPDVHVYSFDLGEHPYSRSVADYLQEKYQNRLHVIWGDSVKTLPRLREVNRDFKCDIVVIDGGHTFRESLSDYFHLRRMVRYNNLVLLDNYPDVSRNYMETLGDVWEGGKRRGEIIEIFHCDYRPKPHGFSVGRFIEAK